MIKRKVLTIAAALTMVLTGAAASAQSLGELVETENLGWAMGRWVATTDQGAEITLVYRWILDKHAIAVAFTMGDYKYQGMIIKMPGYEEKVIEAGADNQGNASKAEWAPEGEKLVSTSTRYAADGKVTAAAMVHSKVDRKTMKVAIHAVENGARADEPWAALEFKRQPRQPKSKSE
jgi:hypothetical protein